MRQEREKTREKSRAHKAHGGQMASRPRRRGPGTKAAGCLQAGNKADDGQTASRQRRPNKKRRTAAGREQGSDTPAEKTPGTGHKIHHNSGRRHKNGRPGRRRGTPGAEKPLRTGKIRVRSFACPEGPCEPGPPKNRFAVFGWHGLFLLRIAHNAARSAAQKGAPPPLIPCKLFEKSLTKNFTAFWPGKNLFLI